MGLRENILRETVADLSLRPLIAVKPRQTVREVCRLMRDAKIGAAIITDDVGKPVGMFNEKLLIQRLTANPRIMDDPVSTHSTTNVVCVKQTDSIARLIATMQGRKLRWVCVVDDAGKAVALTGLRGVMEYVVEHVPRAVKVQPMQSKLAMDHREGA